MIWNSWRENGTLSMINQTETIIQGMKLQNFNTEVLMSNLCDYNDAYILVRDNIAITGNVAAWVTFKNCAPLTKCFTIIDGTTIDHTEDLDLVMSMCNLLEYSLNYYITTGSLWFYSKKKLILVMILQLMTIIFKERQV